MSRIKRQPTAVELEILGNYITSVDRPGARRVKVKCAKDTGQQVFNVLSQCLKYSSYVKGTGWGDFTMWFGSAEYGRQAKADIDGWLALYATKIESGDYGPQVDGGGEGEGTESNPSSTYLIIGAAVLLVAIILLKKKKK